MQLTTTDRNTRLTALKTAIGSGGTLKIFTGSAPGIGNSATGTLLSTLTAVTLGTVSAGAMTLAATADSSAAASGTPGYYRILDSGATVRVEGPAAIGSGELNFGGAVSLGGTVTLSSGSISEGNA